MKERHTSPELLQRLNAATRAAADKLGDDCGAVIVVGVMRDPDGVAFPIKDLWNSAFTDENIRDIYPLVGEVFKRWIAGQAKGERGDECPDCINAINSGELLCKRHLDEY
jgi:hypothetical protein